MTTQRTAEEIKGAVMEHYGSRAKTQLGKTDTIELTATSGDDACAEDGCCGSSETTQEESSGWADKLYSAQELGTVPQEVQEMSLGCGNPMAIAELKPGEAVLDLGSGSGLDCFLAANQVSETGRVVGLDMTDSMLELAARNLKKVGATNVEFTKGEMESMPLPDDQFDVIISNCVINLSPDKDAVFRESARVLKPGGRMRVSDIVWTRTPTAEETSDLASWAGCVAGALEIRDVEAKLSSAGFTDIKIEVTKQGESKGWASADISAFKPAAACC